MPAAKTKTAAKKAAKKQAATQRAAERKPAPAAKAPTRASTKRAARANPAPVATKTPKKKAAKQAPARQPSLGRTVNMGPERGDNSWPPSNKKPPNTSSRAPGATPDGSPAKDSTSGPGGKALEGRAKGKGDQGGDKS